MAVSSNFVAVCWPRDMCDLQSSSSSLLSQDSPVAFSSSARAVTLSWLRAHSITADVEVIPIQKVNEAYERLLKSDVKYRFSIDMASLKSE
jgi:D-arabinose 1-dehydrogenase-like Zn-dependent alcohol dehydrogenase